jgi:antitoxin PrlF
MTSVRVSDKGQVTLPAQIRRRLGIKSRSRLEVEVRNEEIVLHPVKSIMDLAGIFHDAAEGKSTDWDVIRKQTMETVAQEIVDADKR